jgi:hypothetical protein
VDKAGEQSAARWINDVSLHVLSMDGVYCTTTSMAHCARKRYGHCCGHPSSNRISNSLGHKCED